jgi:hypothetical protein
LHGELQDRQDRGYLDQNVILFIIFLANFNTLVLLFLVCMKIIKKRWKIFHFHCHELKKKRFFTLHQEKKPIVKMK